MRRKRERIKFHRFPSPNSPIYRPLKYAKRILKVSTGPEIQEEARKYGADALKCLREIVNSKLASDVAKISAAQTLLDRGYGRPTQTNINAAVGTDGKATEVTQQELDRRVAETIENIERLTKRKREKIESEERPTDIRKYN